MARPSKKLDESSLGYRVRKFRGSSTQEDFARILGISRARLAAIELGNETISRNILERLKGSSDKLSLDWLLTGQGSPTIPPSAPPAPPVNPVNPVNPVPPQPPEFAVPGPPTRIREFMAILLQCPATISDLLRGMPTKYIDGVVALAAAIAPPDVTAPCDIIDGLYVGAGVDYDTSSQFSASQLQLPCPPFAQAHRYHLVTVRGDSMLGLVNDGDQIIVDLSVTSPALCLNRPVVANLDPRRNKADGATCKILERAPAGEALQLRPTNPAHRVIQNIQPNQIIGLVVSILPRNNPRE